VPDQGKKDDNRYGHAQQPKQNSATHRFLHNFSRGVASEHSAALFDGLYLTI
jgi:hypothetical protein